MHRPGYLRLTRQVFEYQTWWDAEVSAASWRSRLTRPISSTEAENRAWDPGAPRSSICMAATAGRCGQRVPFAKSLRCRYLVDRTETLVSHTSLCRVSRETRIPGPRGQPVKSRSAKKCVDCVVGAAEEPVRTSSDDAECPQKRKAPAVSDFTLRVRTCFT